MPDKTAGTRRPAVAGMFYPGDAVELTKTIAEMFAKAEKISLPARPIGLIAPHAGYQYSGMTAARAYKVLEGEDYDTVVVVSPSHTVFFKGCSVFTGAGYETPLGLVETDREIAAKLVGIHPLVHASNQGHATGSTRGEHALEVQLPFLQVVLGKFKLVAVVMGDQEEDSINALGEALGSTLGGTNSLMVASTDLSHFKNEKRARKLDGEVRAAVEAFDPTLLMDTLQSGRGEACGGGPVAAVMFAAKRMGSKEVRFIDYTTSGEATGDFSEVVGYLSAAIVSGKDAAKANAARSLMGARMAKKQEEELTSDDKALLHQIARDAIAAHLAGEKYEPPESERMSYHRGLFVTLKIDEELRGCIGQIKARQPLYQAVAEMAVAAAFEDPRFTPLSAGEYEQLDFEISVLSPLERVKDFSEIKVGRDGLMIKLDMHSGLLLPQVATEHGWRAREFLEQTCLKAGLPKDSYKDRYAEVYRFSAEVF